MFGSNKYHAKFYTHFIMYTIDYKKFMLKMLIEMFTSIVELVLTHSKRGKSFGSFSLKNTLTLLIKDIDWDN